MAPQPKVVDDMRRHWSTRGQCTAGHEARTACGRGPGLRSSPAPAPSLHGRSLVAERGLLQLS
jgi:hypothetical protein